MTRALHWTLLGGCLGLCLLAGRPAWEIACCQTPLASLCCAGCTLRLPLELTASEQVPKAQARETLDQTHAVLALAERD